MDSLSPRRGFLTFLGTAAVTLSGCLRLDSGDSTDDETTTGDTTETTPSQPETTTTTDGTDTQVTNRLQAVGSVGTDITDRRIETVEIVVQLSPGGDSTDLSGVTVQWIDDSGSYDLTAADFGVEAIRDDNDSLSGSDPVLDSPDDRAQLVFDVTDIRESGLSEGESVTLTMTTREGAQTELLLAVPDTLSGAEAVQL